MSISVYSLGPDLLSYIADTIDEPSVGKENATEEKEFQKILNWSDVWVILLTTNGKKLRESLTIFIKYKLNNGNSENKHFEFILAFDYILAIIRTLVT